MASKQIPATSLTDNDTTAQEELGTIRRESDGKEYRYVRNCGSRTLVIGDAVAFHLASSNYYKVHTSNVAVDTVRAGPKQAFAGILVGTIGKGNYGWAQFRGHCTTARITAVGAERGTQVGLYSAQSVKLHALSTSALQQNSHKVGVLIRSASSSWVKSVYLY